MASVCASLTPNPVCTQASDISTQAELHCGVGRGQMRKADADADTSSRRHDPSPTGHLVPLLSPPIPAPATEKAGRRKS